MATSTTLTMADVREYLDAYKAKYGKDTTLTLDAMESIIEKAESDMTADDFAEAFHEAEGEGETETNGEQMADGADRDEDTNTNETDDRSTSVEVDTSPGSAYDYASKMDDKLAEDLETSAKAALENKRGGAVIALDLIRLYGKDTIETVWPEPGSKAEAGKSVIGNRAADNFKAQVRKEDGTTGEGNRSWYQVYVDNSPRGKDLLRQLDSVKAVKAGESDNPAILEEHKALRNDAIKLAVHKAAIEGKRNNAKSALIRAVNLIQRMHFLNTKTDMHCELILEDDGTPAMSNKLVYVKDKKDEKKFNILTIGQLLALKVIEGGTYSAISGSTTRPPKTGTGTQPVEVKIEKVEDFDKVTAVYATFIDRINESIARQDMKAYNALLTHLNAAGTGDLLLSLNSVMNFIEGLLSKPSLSRRLADLLAKEKADSKADKQAAA